MINALKNGSREIEEKRYLQYEKAIANWAYHLDDYANVVNSEDSISILELATGAGLGTCAAVKNLLANNRLISIDIDFAAARNADGIGSIF